MSKYDNKPETPVEREGRMRGESAERLKGFLRKASELPRRTRRVAGRTPTFWERLEWTYNGRW